MRGLTVIGAASSRPRRPEEAAPSACLPDLELLCPWTLRGRLLQIPLRICELSHIFTVNVGPLSVSPSLFLSFLKKFKVAKDSFCCFDSDLDFPSRAVRIRTDQTDHSSSYVDSDVFFPSF